MLPSAKEKFEELMNLSKEKAKSLKASNYYHDYDSWREYFDNGTYRVYINSGCNSKEDLIKIAGLAYSWMPTMLDLYYENSYDWDGLLRSINEFKQGKREIRQKLVMALSTLINHSIVGASKALHLIKPEFAPLVDSRVAKGWNHFFEEEIRVGKINRLPGSWNWTKTNEQTKKVNSYILYWDTLLDWKEALNNQISIRDLEVNFYLIGGHVKNSSK